MHDLCSPASPTTIIVYGNLEIGDEYTNRKRGELIIHNGSKVVFEDGADLKIFKNSKLVIENGAELEF